MKQVFHPFLVLFIMLAMAFGFSSCTPIKIINVLSAGHIKQNDFSETVSFNYEGRHLYVQPEINGKKYHFILDSGAPTILDRTIAEKLNLDSITTMSAKGVKGKTSEVILSKIDSLKLDDLTFYDCGAGIADLSSKFPFSCYPFDGILGSNIMKQAIWQIDFENQKIHVVSHKNKLPTGYGEIKKEMSAGIIYGIPHIEDFPFKNHKFTIDLGSRGCIGLTKPALTDIKPELAIAKIDKGIGYNSYGFNGSYADTLTYIDLESLQIGQQYKIPAQVRSTANDDNLIGLEFLQFFTVTLDWKNGIFALNRHNDKPSLQSHFATPIRLKLDGDNITIGRIFKNSDLSHKGLHFGDTVVSITNIAGEEKLPSSACDAFKLNLDPGDELLIRKKGSLHSYRL